MADDQDGGRRRHRRRLGIFVAMGVLIGGGTAIWGWHVVANGGRANVQATGAPHRGGPVLLSTTTSTTLPPTTTTTDPGILPQTTAFPSTQSPQFESEMSDLFGAIVTDSFAMAEPAYFPESAYLQLKTIDNPRSDYVNRLEEDFTLDIGAAHALLGNDANTARLLEVTAPSGFGHWVPPGVCDNSVGYYELPNARVVYQEDGQIRSFGIASMISWRGSVVRRALGSNPSIIGCGGGGRPLGRTGHVHPVLHVLISRRAQSALSLLSFDQRRAATAGAKSALMSFPPPAPRRYGLPSASPSSVRPLRRDPDGRSAPNARNRPSSAGAAST